MIRLSFFLATALSFLLIGLPAASKPGEWTSAIALEGRPALPPDGRLPYVSDQGRRGGNFQLGVVGSFDRLNPLMLGGRGPRGMMELVIEPLALTSLNEPTTLYGLLAESMLLAHDQRSISFRLHPQATFSTGDPVRAEDVRLSYEWLISGQASPFWRQYWQGIERVVVLDARTIRFDFREANPELAALISGLPVFRVNQWSADHGLIGSGPYQVSRWSRGTMVEYSRRKEYWGKDTLPRRGQFHFERIIIRYARDASMLKQWADSGQLDVWTPSDFDRLDSLPAGMSLQTFPNTNPTGMHGIFFNLRKAGLSDVRVRRALALLFDFNWLNRQVFQGKKQPSLSFFANTEFAAQGVLPPAERALAESLFRQAGREIPPELWQSLDSPARSPEQARQEAVRLLESAGWVWTKGRIHPPGQTQVRLDLALHDPSLAGPLRVWQSALEHLGIELQIIQEDAIAHRRRLMEGRYDLASQHQLGTTRPGPELVARFSSQAAGLGGTDALNGLQDPVIDALLGVLLKSESPQARLTAGRLLDRVLRSRQIVLGLWHNASHRVITRRGLSWPQQPPDVMDPEVWLLMSGWWGKPQ